VEQGTSGGQRRRGIAAVLSVLAAAPACACTCLNRTAAEAFARADVVFIGTVLDDGHGSEPRSSPTVTMIFDVSEVRKGTATRTQGVSSLGDGALCGLELQRGQRYVVFADQNGDRLTASLCGGTRPADQAGPLPPGQAGPPAPGFSGLAEDPDSDRRWWLGAGVVLTLAGGGLLASTRRRHHR